MCYDGKEKRLLKIDKNENPEMIPHCTIHREILVSKTIRHDLNEAIKSITKCMNATKLNDT